MSDKAAALRTRSEYSTYKSSHLTMSKKETILGQMLPIIWGEAPKLFDQASPNNKSILAVSPAAFTPQDEIEIRKLSGSRAFGVPGFRRPGRSAYRVFGVPGVRRAGFSALRAFVLPGVDPR